MAGVYVPLVLIPRYTTYCGGDGAEFATIAMDVSDYDKAVMSFWREAGLNLTGLTIQFQESMDQQHWTACAGGPFSDPGANSEVQFSPVLTKRWMRILLTLATLSTAVVTGWCIGFLVQRES